VDLVEGLHVQAACRDVGFANDFCARAPQARNERRVCRGRVAALAPWQPAHGGHARHINRVLDQNGEAREQGAARAHVDARSCAAARRIDGVHDSIQVPVHRLDSAQGAGHARVQPSHLVFATLASLWRTH